MNIQGTVKLYFKYKETKNIIIYWWEKSKNSINKGVPNFFKQDIKTEKYEK